jgi:hypothetical protein
VSPSGKYLFVLCEVTHDYELYDCDNWNKIATGQNIKSIVWGLQSDTIAILKFDSNCKKLSVYRVVDMK